MFLINACKYMLWPLIWTASMKQLRWGVTIYISIKILMKITFIIIKYCLCGNFHGSPIFKVFGSHWICEN